MPGLDTLFDPAALILAKVDAELTAALAGKTLREARDLIDQPKSRSWSLSQTVESID